MPAVIQRLLIVIFVLGLPAAAVGQERPKLDPNSPAGVEYQLPLDRAREEAAGETQRDSGGPKPAPPFGVGLTERGPSPKGGGSGGSDEGAGDRLSDEVSALPDEFSSTTTRANTVPALFPVASEGEAGVSAPLIAAAVLLVGGALGLGLRRALGGNPGQ